MCLGLPMGLAAAGVECDSGIMVSRMFLILQAGLLEAAFLGTEDVGGLWKASSKSLSNSSVFISSSISLTFSSFAGIPMVLKELSSGNSSTWLRESQSPVVGVLARAWRNGGITAAADLDLSRTLAGGIDLSSFPGSFSASWIGSKNFLCSFVLCTGSETTLLFARPTRTGGGIDVDGPAAKVTVRE